MERYAYCPSCGKAVTFVTIKRRQTGEAQGRRFVYKVSQAICDLCGSEATYPPYQEAAGIAFNNAIRHSEGLVALEVICEVPRRYAIGKRPLSRVLGLGEHTYSQLMEGQVPNRKHSKLIQSIYDDPGYYRSLLEAGKSEIAPSVYSRSVTAVESYMRNDWPEAYLIYEIGRALVHLAKGDITGKAVQKLTYYIQGFSFPLLGSPIFAQMPHAWAMGPVYGQLWHEYRDNASRYFAYREDEEYSSPFAPAEDELIRAVYRHFGCYSGDVLGSMTHEEAPWREARKRAGVKVGEWCNEPLARCDVEVFFESIVDKYKIAQADDVGKYARYAFARAMGLRV